MATWFVRLLGRTEVWGRDIDRAGEPFQLLITGVPRTMDGRDLQELLEAAGISLYDGYRPYYYAPDFSRIDGHLAETSGDTWLLSYEDKQALRALEGTEKHLCYADILKRARMPVFPELEQVSAAPKLLTASSMPLSAVEPPRQKTEAALPDYATLCRWVDSYVATDVAQWRTYQVEREQFGEIVTWRIYKDGAEMGRLVLSNTGLFWALVAGDPLVRTLPPREEDLRYLKPETRVRVEALWDFIESLTGYLDCYLPGWCSEPAPEQAPHGADIEQRAARGPIAETRRRAELFEQIKAEHPNYSYAQVAQAATSSAKVRHAPDEMPPQYHAHDVRNAYKAMGWTWEKGNIMR